jgi:large subunit ribosomal protein L31
MQDKMHPESKPTEFICACGNHLKTVSTLGGERHIEICSMCHPFFTGKEKLVDKAGRIEKFKRRYAKKDEAAPAAKA